MLRLSTTPVEVVAATAVTDDPADAGPRIELLERNVLALQSTRLGARRSILRLPRVAVVYQAASDCARSRTRVRSDVRAYLTFGPRAAGLVDGLAVRPGMMLAASPGAEAGFVVRPGWETIAVLVPPGIVRQHLATRRRGSGPGGPPRVEALQVEPERARDLFECGKRLVQTVSNPPARCGDSSAESASAEANLLATLLSALCSGRPLEPTNRDRTLQIHSRIVSIAEDFALARPGERTQVADLCRAADISERTLEAAFKAVTGLTPHAYLTRLRLHRVRAALLSAEPGTTKISTEALRWGFSHFGDFSRHYRECFGELPSTTLRHEAR